MPRPETDVAGSPRARLVRALTFGIPALAAALAYAAAIHNGFAVDDVPIVVHDPTVHAGPAAILRILSAPYWPGSGALYRPLTKLAYAVQWSLWGNTPGLFHLVNVLCHVAVTLLVVRLAERWLPPAAALGTGLLFALHPVHVEAIANVVGLAELLACAGLVGVALVATRAGDATRGRWYAVAALSALALGGKETGVAAPVIAAAAAWTVGRSPRATWRLAAASLAGVAPLLLLRLLVLRTLGDAPHPALGVGTPLSQLALVLATLPHTALLLVAPVLPSPDYSPTLQGALHPSPLLALLGVALLLAVVMATVAHVRRPSPTTFAVVFAGVTLAPVSNLFFHSGVYLAERTLYSPSVGAALLGGVLAAAAWRAIRAGRAAWSARLAITGATALWIAVGAANAWSSVPTWRDTGAMARTTIARSPSSYIGYRYAGALLLERGESDSAWRLLSRGVTLFPYDVELDYTAGQVARIRGDGVMADSMFALTLRASPGDRRARQELISSHLLRGDAASARRLLEDGLRLEPDQRRWRALLDSLDAAPARAAR